MNTKPAVNIVLIDDDYLDNYIHQKVIERSGYGNIVGTFELAVDALNWLQASKRNVEIIFLDINMPLMNGFEFLQNYNQNQLLSGMHTKIVMLSSAIQDRDQERAALFNVRCATKPLNPEQLDALTKELRC